MSTQKYHRILTFTKSILWLVICVFITNCEKSLNLELKEELPINVESFDQAKGLTLPYPLYLPNSITGWAIDSSTQFHFDEIHNLYILEGISLTAKPNDEQGYRFKICGESWLYQFGFGSYITDDESTIGLSESGTVVRVERFPQASTDIRIELPATIDKKKNPLLRVEFKLTRWEPTPQGLLKTQIYYPSENSTTEIKSPALVN